MHVCVCVYLDLSISPAAGRGIEPWRNLVGRCKGQGSLQHHFTASRLSRETSRQSDRQADSYAMMLTEGGRQKGERIGRKADR